MQTIRERTKDHFPSVLLTLLGIIQALALELLWSRLRGSDYLWDGGISAVVGWVQAAVLMLGIFLVWLFYTSIVMRVSWVPSIQDSALPFAIGVLEFAVVDLMGPETLSFWFAGFAMIFALSTFASHSAFKRARLDPDNRDFFEAMSPTSRRDLAQPAAIVAGLLLLALVVRIDGGWGWIGLGALIATGGALVHQIEILRRYWNRSISPNAETNEPSSPG
ncbi:MAG: hypothetical protein JRE13_12385 [Deltaproteobacteria bacterium]|nr:hypothetical protein [Deltaproteobacteria bacterium]